MEDIDVDQVSTEEPSGQRSKVPTADRRRIRPEIWPRLVAGGAALAGLTWMVAAVLCANRGLDLSDESFYLLSYRWWDVNYDTFTGAQYIFGPVFEALGHNIAYLRIFRMVILVLAHVWFGWSFMGWLRTQRPQATASRWWEVAGTCVIVACAGIVYSWLPLSPGYNDLALTCSVFLAGGALRIAAAGADARAPWWVPTSIGSVTVVMAMGKWSSTLVVVATIAVALVVVHVAGRRGWLSFLRLLGFMVLGGAIAAAVIEFLLVPFGTFLPPMREVTSLVAGSTNSPSVLLQTYVDGAETLGTDMLRQHWPLLLVAAVVPFLQAIPRVAIGLVAAAGAVSVVRVVLEDGTIAGPLNLGASMVTVFTPLTAVAIVGIVSAIRRSSRGGLAGWRAAWTRPAVARWAVLGMLVAVPVAQAAGTGNFIHYLAVAGLGVWAAVAITVVTGLEEPARPARVLVAAATAGLVLATSVIAVDGLWNRPYRSTAHDVSTEVAEGVPALASQRFDPSDAEEYARLHALLEPWIKEPGRAMMGYDGLSGLIFLLDGRPVGEAWYPGRDTRRSEAGVRRACRSEPWWGDREPIVMFNRPVKRREVRALRSCGLSLKDDYRLITSTLRGADLSIYVPRDEEVR